jgi:hypothetical protein
MNSLIAWFGFGRPTFSQVDKTAKDTPVDAAAPLTRATYREVLLRSIDGTPEHEAAVLSTYVVVPPQATGTACDALSSRLVYADV